MMLREDWYLLMSNAAITPYEHDYAAWLGRAGCAGGSAAPPGPEQQCLPVPCA